MSIDPRTLKQLLQLQLLNKLDLSLSSSDSTTASDNKADTSFDDILKNLLEQQPAAALPLSDNDANPLNSRLASGSLGFYPPSLSSPSSYDPLIDQASKQYGVDSSLIKAVIDTESSFKNHEISSSGAKGLMQLMDDTGRGLGVTDPFDPQQNIQAGTHFLADLLKSYNGSESMALAAYNGGPGRLANLGITNENQLAAKYHLLPQETQKYVHKVLQLKQDYQI